MTGRPSPRLLWRPTSQRIEQATLTRFAQWLERERGIETGGDYEALWRWSVDDLEGFWQAIWDHFEVRSDVAPERVLGDRSMPGAQWFPGASLSYAAHVLQGRDPDALALQHASELAGLQAWSWGDLSERTAAIAAGLRELGVGRGDRVAAYLPNLPDTVAAFLACASIGAVWASAAPEFGVRAVVDRFAQITPKVLLAVDGYRYGGRDFPRADAVRQIADELPSLEHVVQLGHLDGGGWQEGFLRPGVELVCDPLPFDHPLWVLFSSGTTGLPKAIVHSQGGMLLEQLKLMHLHLDAKPEDRIFWFTTTGWMMWNFLVGVLLTDASIVLFDGNPLAPDPAVLWDLAEEAGVTCFGTSASYLMACRDQGVEPHGDGRALAGLSSVGSTGSPLPPEGFAWIYEHVGEDTWLFSTSGGTDVCTAFVGGVPTLPVYEGELQARALGARIEAFDEQGAGVVDEVGELVLTAPMPSMPIALWGDATGERLRETYYDTYPGIWRHGDWIEITSRGTAVIHGRSDATINRGGIRMGTADIYRAVLAEPEVSDALVVDVPRSGQENWMPLFVVLRDDEALSDELIARIRRRIRADCSPRHAPDEVRQVASIPRTLSGKLLEVPVKRILMGADADTVVSRDALADPEALEPFVALGGG